MPKIKSRSQRKSKKSKLQASTDSLPLSKKEQQGIKRQAARDRKELFKVLTPTLVASAVIGLLLFVLKGYKLAIAGGGGLLVLVMSFKYHRQALWAFLIYLPISGTVTYEIGGGSPIFQVAKDAFYFPALIALIQHLKRKRLPILIAKGLIQPLYILLTACILTLIFVNGAQQFSSNPEGRPILLGFLGLKIFLGYIPLIVCGYYLIRNKKELLFLSRLHVVLVLICCGLGLLQFLLLYKGICPGTRNFTGDQLFKPDISVRCLVGGALSYSPQVNTIRLPGTFVSPWHWGWFLISNTFFTFASAFSEHSLFWQVTSFISLALVFVNAVISGQRIALILVPIFIVILLVLTGQIANLKRFLPIVGGLGVLAAIAMALFPQVIMQRVESLIARWQASPPTDFIANQVDTTSRGQTGLLGQGVGRATNSARIFNNDGREFIETWFPKVYHEIGPIGLIAFLIFVTALTWITFKVYRSLKDKSLRSYGASLWVFVLFISYNTYWYPLDTDPVAVYYWFFAGVILKLPVLDLQEDEEGRTALA